MLRGHLRADPSLDGMGWGDITGAGPDGESARGVRARGLRGPRCGLTIDNNLLIKPWGCHVREDLLPILRRGQLQKHGQGHAAAARNGPLLYLGL